MDRAGYQTKLTTAAAARRQTVLRSRDTKGVGLRCVTPASIGGQARPTTGISLWTCARF
jgi:hypothetical protein